MPFEHRSLQRKTSKTPEDRGLKALGWCSKKKALITQKMELTSQLLTPKDT
jgi:hypothetical protein